MVASKELVISGRRYTLEYDYKASPIDDQGIVWIDSKHKTPLGLLDLKIGVSRNRIVYIFLGPFSFLYEEEPGRDDGELLEKILKSEYTIRESGAFKKRPSIHVQLSDGKQYTEDRYSS